MANPDLPSIFAIDESEDAETDSPVRSLDSSRNLLSPRASLDDLTNQTSRVQPAPSGLNTGQLDGNAASISRGDTGKRLQPPGMLRLGSADTRYALPRLPLQSRVFG